MAIMFELPLKIFRYKPGQAPHYDLFRVQIADTAYVLDAIEAAWAQHDRTLTFRHACHHASCGSCAVRVNGREKLPCITLVRDVWDGHSALQIDPLRNFRIVSDLVVDASDFYRRMEASGMAITRTAEPVLPLSVDANAELDEQPVDLPDGLSRFNRFENCIECAICLSACPTLAADDKFFGPAGLAAIDRARRETADPAESIRLLELADGEHGVWRCHSAWECTEVCPQNVQPAESIMYLRRDLMKRRFKRVFGR
ncbi:MAG TPA: 2Fe-2S iron-sulfur cluster-binding protein [Anaerolineae bacterium]|nr:2Fe-2S iron-sulfur cluster-binding protein [Anaerolineae bacterium]